MELTRFHKLCNAYGTAQEKFEAYKTDCHLLSIEIVKELKAYYNVPETQFSLYSINADDDFELVTPALIHAIQLKEDHFWHFGVGLTVCRAPETLPEELILIHLMFRKNNKDQYFIKYAYDDQEFEVKKGKLSSYTPFFDFIFDAILNSYDTQLQQFVGQKTKRRLGFRVYN